MNRKTYYIIGSLAGVFLSICACILALYFRVRAKNIHQVEIINEVQVSQPLIEPESEPVAPERVEEPEDAEATEESKPLNIIEYINNAEKAANNCELSVLRENLRAAETLAESTLKQTLVQHKRAIFAHKCGVLLFKKGEFTGAKEAFEQAYDAFLREATLHDAQEDLIRSTAATVNANKVLLFIKRSRIEELLKTAKDLEQKKDYLDLLGIYKQIVGLYENDADNYKILYEGLCIKTRAETEPEFAQVLWQECYKVLMGATSVFVGVEEGDFAASRIMILRDECIAEIMLLKNEFEECISNLNSAIQHLKNTKNQQLAADAQIYMDQLEQKLDRAKKAKREAEYRASGLFEEKARVIATKAQEESESNNYDKAAHLYQKAGELYSKELVVQKNLDREEEVLRLEKIISRTNKLALDAEIKFLLKMAKEADSVNDFEAERAYRAKIVEILKGLDNPIALRKAEIAVKLSETKKYFDRNNLTQALQSGKEAVQLSEDYKTNLEILAFSEYAQKLVDYILLSKLKVEFSYKAKEIGLLKNRIEQGLVKANMPEFEEYNKLLSEALSLELTIKAKEFAFKNKYDKEVNKDHAEDAPQTKDSEDGGPVEVSVDERDHKTAEEENLEVNDGLIESLKDSELDTAAEALVKEEKGEEYEVISGLQGSLESEGADQSDIVDGYEAAEEGYETAEED